jgi:hypothetical protein
MAELVDALDLGSSTARCEGSSPFVRITFKYPRVYRVKARKVLPIHSRSLMTS